MTSPSLSPATSAIPRVAVITRTRNRPLMLKRTLASISQQTSRDFIWILANHGGDAPPVEAIAAEARSLGVNAKYIYVPAGKCVGDPANAAIAASQSHYLVLHDDDDTWEPDFLKRTGDFLDNEPKYHAVVTRAAYVEEEEITKGSGQYHTIRRTVFNPSLASVQISQCAIRNQFPPISFVFRRSVLAVSGLYDDNLPALEDWDLTLRILRHFDIGLIPVVLANYHIRTGVTGVYSNTLGQERISSHAEYDAIIRNRFIRADLESGKFGLGALLAMGDMTQGQEVLLRLAVLLNRIRGKWWMRPFRKLLGVKTLDIK